MKLGISFGALAPKIADQLREQGVTAPKDIIIQAQKDTDAIARLSVRGMLSDAATQSARRRVLKFLLARATKEGT